MALGLYKPGRLLEEKGKMVGVTKENFAGLTAGMTLAQLQERIGQGRRAIIKDLEEATGMLLHQSTAWASAVARSRVQIWKVHYELILAAFSGDPSAGGKVAVLFHDYNAPGCIMCVVKPAGTWEISDENYHKLKVGMTLKQVEEILGEGRPFVYESLWGSNATDDSGILAWRKADKEGRVRCWHEGEISKSILENVKTEGMAVGGGRIMVAFTGDPAADGKVDVFSGQFGHDQWVKTPADKWEVSKNNFLKLKVGMTLKELEDIIGVGQPLKPDDVVEKGRGAQTRADAEAGRVNWNRGWEKAAQEYRVYEWKGAPKNLNEPGPRILAGFPVPPPRLPLPRRRPSVTETAFGMKTKAHFPKRSRALSSCSVVTISISRGQH